MVKIETKNQVIEELLNRDLEKSLKLRSPQPNVGIDING